MRRINITLDEETSNLLAKSKNQAESVREYIRMYHCGITPDTLQGMKASYGHILKEISELKELVQWQGDLLEKLNNKVPEF